MKFKNLTLLVKTNLTFLVILLDTSDFFILTFAFQLHRENGPGLSLPYY